MTSTCALCMCSYTQTCRASMNESEKVAQSETLSGWTIYSKLLQLDLAEKALLFEGAVNELEQRRGCC